VTSPAGDEPSSPVPSLTDGVRVLPLLAGPPCDDLGPSALLPGGALGRRVVRELVAVEAVLLAGEPLAGLAEAARLEVAAWAGMSAGRRRVAKGGSGDFRIRGENDEPGLDRLSARAASVAGPGPATAAPAWTGADATELRVVAGGKIGALPSSLRMVIDKGDQPVPTQAQPRSLWTRLEDEPWWGRTRGLAHSHDRSRGGSEGSVGNEGVVIRTVVEGSRERMLSRPARAALDRMGRGGLGWRSKRRRWVLVRRAARAGQVQYARGAVDSVF